MQIETVQVNRDPSLLAALYSEYGGRFDHLSNSEINSAIALLAIARLTKNHSLFRAMELMNTSIAPVSLPDKFLIAANQMTPHGRLILSIVLLNSLKSEP